MQEKMWAYLIHLGSNMWDDRYAQNPAVPFPAIPKYREELLAPKDVWTKVTDFLAEAGLNTLVIDLGEGVQYASHPELGAKGAWTVAELRAELDRLRAMGITPIPKLNFSCCHDAWHGDVLSRLPRSDRRGVRNLRPSRAVPYRHGRGKSQKSGAYGHDHHPKRTAVVEGFLLPCGMLREKRRARMYLVGLLL